MPLFERESLRLTLERGRLARPVQSATWAVVSLVLLLLVGCQASDSGQAPTRVDAPPGGPPGFFPPPAATEQGREISSLYSVIFWIAAAIFVLVEGLIIWSVLRYRRRDDTLPPQTHGHNVAEILWTVIPAAIVLAVFVLSTNTLFRVEARSDRPAVTVDAYAFQWQWAFGYDCPPGFDSPGGFTRIEDCRVPLPAGTGNKGPQMVLPVGETVRIRLHSTDVNHAFYVPQFLYKKDVIPGQVNRFDVKVEQPGTYTGQCAEFCGLAHAAMTFTVRAVPTGEFEAWKQQAQRDAEERARATPPPPPAQGPGGGASVSISAASAAGFDQKALEVPANSPFTIQFQNKDSSAPHNVAIKNATNQGDFIPPVAQAGQTATYSAPALPAGQYEFYCSVHPNMKGTLTAK
ncbi:MAG: cytochrome c oxidase subunit II [Chloroflexota bacterium]|nr:cytochrome c oxidase subunit II [Chloroflexota bacterium]